MFKANILGKPLIFTIHKKIEVPLSSYSILVFCFLFFINTNTYTCTTLVNINKFQVYNFFLTTTGMHWNACDGNAFRLNDQNRSNTDVLLERVYD